jgi:hypothetical protein
MSHAQLEAMILEMGGHWVTVVEPGYGVISHGDAAVFVSVTPSIDDDDGYSPEEKAEMSAILGSEARALVSIEIGHEAGSEVIARQVAQRIAGVWGGAEDWRDAL